jgi:hypothetical protein
MAGRRREGRAPDDNLMAGTRNNGRSDIRMDPVEIQAKATIVAALIASHAVDIPSMPKIAGHWTQDPAAIRLRELTDRVYDTITTPRP